MSPQKIDRIFHALADPNRLAMVEQLSIRPLSVSDLAKPFKMSLAAVVQHVQVLEECGLVLTAKEGRVRTCRLVPESLSAAEQWMMERRALWERRFDLLQQLVEEDD